MSVPFALDENGKLISALSQSSNFKELTCVECHNALIRKNGARSHFAHRKGTAHRTGESYYHKSAKRILCENDVVMFHTCKYCPNEISHRIQADRCTEEFGWEYNKQQFRIDVAEIHENEPKAFVEVMYTHACSANKVDAFRESGMPWFEINAQTLCEIFEKPNFFLKIKPIKSSLPEACDSCREKKTEPKLPTEPDSLPKPEYLPKQESLPKPEIRFDRPERLCRLEWDQKQELKQLDWEQKYQLERLQREHKEELERLRREQTERKHRLEREQKERLERMEERLLKTYYGAIWRSKYVEL